MHGALKSYWEKYGQATQLIAVFTMTVLGPSAKIFTYPGDSVATYIFWWIVTLNGIAVTGVGFRNLIHTEAKRALLETLAQAARNLPPHPDKYSPEV